MTGMPTTPPRDADDLLRRLTLAESMLRAIPAFVYVFNLRRGEYVGSNGDLRRYLGFASESVAHLSDSEFSASLAHPDDADDYLRMLVEHHALVPGQQLSRRVRLRSGDGSYRWFHHNVVGLSFDADGVIETLGTLNDVTTVVHAADRLQASERRFRELFHRSPAGTVVIDDDGVVIEANEAMAALLGVPTARLIGSIYDRFVHPEERDEVAARRHTMAGSQHAATQVQRRLIHADGSVLWVQVLISRIQEGDRFVTLLAFDDVTAERAAKERLEHAALHDSLTGLPNRRLLGDRLEQALQRSRRLGCLTSVLYLDLDRVKQVNDALGHAAGDVALEIIGRRLAAEVRESDTVARVGGDEFVVVCEGVDDPDHVTQLADRLLAVIAEPMDVHGNRVVLTASIGLVSSTGDASADELLGAADMAMYEAKAAGRARVALAAPSRPRG
jgi:diguanylate cyclase (GGDEF)-like protein/PAS domain S-box-containing protein